MSCLDATFTLTPRSPRYSSGQGQYCDLLCYGADFLPGNPLNLSSLYSADRFFFDGFTAADPTIDYSQFANRMRVPFLELAANLSGYGTAKQLALIFGFEVINNGRVLVYNDAGLISDQTLAVTDNQFLLEIELQTDWFYLYFVHAGGDWFFRGLSGYVV